MRNQTCSIKNRESNKKRLLILTMVCMFFVVVVPGCSKSWLPKFKMGKFGDGITNTQYTSDAAGQLKNSSKSIEKSAQSIKETSKDIQDDSSDIIEDTAKLIDNTQDNDSRAKLYDIQKKSVDIADNAERINIEAKEIIEENQNVKSAASSLESTEKDLRSYKEKGALEAKKKLYGLIIKMAAAGGLIVIGGIALAFFNARMGGMLAAFGMIITMIAVAGTYYLQWIALAGFGMLALGLIVTLAFLAKSFWRARILEDSHEANIELIDDMKDSISDEQREELFHDDGKAAKIQSKRVKRAVSDTRKKIKKRKDK